MRYAPRVGGSDLTGRFSGREAQHRALEALVRRAAAGGLSALDDQELEDLGRLYRAATTHLALLRAGGGSSGQRERLNELVARAHALIYSAAAPDEAAHARAWLVALLQVPVAVRRRWRCHLLAAALLLLGVLYGWLGARGQAEWAQELMLAPGDERTPWATREELLASLHGERGAGAGENAAFAAVLWQNNTRAALSAFFLGFLGGVPTALVLLLNGAVLGAYTHTYLAQGLGWEWGAWVLPHGVTELLAIVLLAGGGLAIAHAVVAPGERTRGEALRELRPDAVRHLLLAFPMLLLAAGLESFLRRSGLPDPARWAVAALSALGWAVWLGLARPPARWVRALTPARTTLERRVPLPLDEDLLGIQPAAGARRRAPPG